MLSVDVSLSGTRAEGSTYIGTSFLLRPMSRLLSPKRRILAESCLLAPRWRLCAGVSELVSEGVGSMAEEGAPPDGTVSM